MNRIPRVQMVFFDAGGTLLGTNTDVPHWYEQFFVEACAELGVDASLPAVQEALGHAVRTFPGGPRCSCAATTRAYWQHVYQSTYAAVLPADFDTAAIATASIDRFERGEFIELFDDARPALDALAGLPVRMAVTSNFGSYLADFTVQLGIADRFEFLHISANEGTEKPALEFFARALKRAALDPAEVLVVGDSAREDYEPARALGMNAVLIDRWGRVGGPADAPRLRRLDDLPAWMRDAGLIDCG